MHGRPDIHVTSVTQTRNIIMANTFFRTAYDRLVLARERQARRYINGQLLSFDDDTLTALGHSREKLLRERMSGTSF
jgi:hypothetical protein